MNALCQQSEVVTDEEKADLVERIQRATRGMDIEELRWTIAAWEFMANDLRRVVALNGGVL